MIAENVGPTNSPARSIALAALLIAVGNIASRLLGLGRVTVIALFFGRSAGVDAYAAAWTVPNTIYDVLIAGAVSAVFVPVFSEYAEGDRREFARIVSGVATCVLLILLALIALLAWQAPLLGRLLVQSSRPDVYEQTVLLIRLLLPAVLLMGMAGLATAALHAQRKFLLPASIGAIFNAGVILGASAVSAPAGRGEPGGRRGDRRAWAGCHPGAGAARPALPAHAEPAPSGDAPNRAPVRAGGAGDHVSDRRHGD